MQILCITAFAYLAACALFALHRSTMTRKVAARTALVLLVLSVGITTSLVVADNMDLVRVLMPLHLCSACALLSVYYYARGARGGFNLLYYAGMPGAFMALCFPAVAVNTNQALMDFSFYLTHSLIVFAPLLAIACGDRPRRSAAISSYGILLGFSVCVYVFNAAFGANYLFLMDAPAGTPLMAIQSLGRVYYIAVLALLAALVILFQYGLARLVCALPQMARLTRSALHAEELAAGSITLYCEHDTSRQKT